MGTGSIAFYISEDFMAFLRCDIDDEMVSRKELAYNSVRNAVQFIHFVCHQEVSLQQSFESRSNGVNNAQVTHVFIVFTALHANMRLMYNFSLKRDDSSIIFLQKKYTSTDVASCFLSPH